MSTRTEIINSFYNQINEDARLGKSRQGQLEYHVTMHYIHKFLQPGARVLEIGAGTGRYSVALAKEGCRVSAVELVESNLDVLKKNAEGLDNLEAFQGDALDLGRFGAAQSAGRGDSRHEARRGPSGRLPIRARDHLHQLSVRLDADRSRSGGKL